MMKVGEYRRGRGGLGNGKEGNGKWEMLVLPKLDLGQTSYPKSVTATRRRANSNIKSSR
jgi:hypothetical protein